jgi:oxygen-dependent protoporphyrinogen oxidase
VLPARKRQDDESVESFVRRRFGREHLERLAGPLVGGIYTGDPARLSVRATLARFVELEQRHGSVIKGLRAHARSLAAEEASGARYGLFVSPEQGMGSLVDALVGRLPDGCLKLGTSVTALSPEGAGWRAELSTGERRAVDAVCLALPAHVQARLLSGVDAELARPLSQVRHASSAIVSLGYRAGDASRLPLAVGVLRPRREPGHVFAVSFLSAKYPRRAPADGVLLRCFVGGMLDASVLERDDLDLLALVREELGQLLGLGATPVRQAVHRWPQAMPQYELGHAERVRACEQAARRWPTLALAGNGLHGVGIPDCVKRAEREAERLLAALELGGR